MIPSPRRPTLSPIGLDIVLAASQVPHGIRLSDLATVIGSPVSSVQTALRILGAHGIIRRHGGAVPRYGVSIAHPAWEQIVDLATVLPEPEHAMAIILRANPAAAYAAVDAHGFVAAIDDALNAEASLLLDRHLNLVRATHHPLPALLRVPQEEFGRLVVVDLELRRRLEVAITLKGSLPRVPRSGLAGLSRRRTPGTGIAIGGGGQDLDVAGEREHSGTTA